MGIIIIVPIIPAFVFFKIIPNEKSDVEGTFAGMKFKLGGAFAGYFLIFFVMIMVFDTDLIKVNKEDPSWEIWDVEGRVGFEGGDGSNATLQFKVDPPIFRAFADKIKVRIFSEPDHSDQREFPIITVSHENFIPSFIEITENDSINDELKKVILKNKIVLRKSPE